MLAETDRSAVGRLRIAVNVAAGQGGTRPTLMSVSEAWKGDPLFEPAYLDGGWVFRFVTTKEAHTARTGDPVDRGPAGGTFWAQLAVAGSQVQGGAGAVRFFVTSDETEFGWPVGDTKVERQELASDLA
jgi:hypothetical protein